MPAPYYHAKYHAKRLARGDNASHVATIGSSSVAGDAFTEEERTQITQEIEMALTCEGSVAPMPPPPGPKAPPPGYEPDPAFLGARHYPSREGGHENN